MNFFASTYRLILAVHYRWGSGRLITAPRGCQRMRAEPEYVAASDPISAHHHLTTLTLLSVELLDLGWQGIPISMGKSNYFSYLVCWICPGVTVKIKKSEMSMPAINFSSGLYRRRQDYRSLMWWGKNDSRYCKFRREQLNKKYKQFKFSMV